MSRRTHRPPSAAGARYPSRAPAAGIFFRRYVAWLDRRWLAVVATTALVFAASIYLTAFHLPLKADLAYLLPQDAGAVRDLRRLEARLAAKDTMLAVIVAPDARTRDATAADAIARIHAISPDLIERLETDDADTRAFLRAHRQLYVPLEDLEHARDALARQVALHANPLYLDLDDDAPDPELEKLRAKRREAESRLDQPALVRGNMALGLTHGQLFDKRRGGEGAVARAVAIQVGMRFGVPMSATGDALGIRSSAASRLGASALDEAGMQAVDFVQRRLWEELPRRE